LTNVSRINNGIRMMREWRVVKDIESNENLETEEMISNFFTVL
jgi:hypothetical protein